MQSRLAAICCRASRPGPLRLSFSAVRCVSNARAAGTSPATVAVNNLKTVLDSEITYEKDSISSEKAPDSSEKFFQSNGFSLASSAGDSVVVLTKNQGDVAIKLSCDIRQLYMNENFEEEEEMEEEKEDEVSEFDEPLSVQISLSKKGSSSLVSLECALTSDGVEVLSLEALREDKEPAEKPFLGPNFSDLSEELQNAVSDYIESLGVNGELSTALRDYVEHKERMEYFDWLKRVRVFF